ncbi:uncharacterized protein LOC134095593 isoform X2 [Sardina pilchardus]
MKVVPAVIRQFTDIVHLTCETSLSPLSHCYFAINGGNWTWSESSRLALSGNDLIAWSGQRDITEIELMCQCFGSMPLMNSPYSERTLVTIVGPPQLLLFRQLISETDTVHLTCQTPQSPLVSQCFLSVGGKPLSVVMPSCQLQRTGKELIHWSGVRPPAQISLSCYYTVKTTPQLSSDPSQPVSITVGKDWVGVQLFTSTVNSTSIIAGSEEICTRGMIIVGGIMFLGGLITSFLCLKIRRCAFKRQECPPDRDENLSIGFLSTTISPGVIGDEGMTMSSKAAASDTKMALESEQGSIVDPVYSSIPDIPIVADQEDSSVEHVYSHLEPTQDNNIYSDMYCGTSDFAALQKT